MTKLKTVVPSRTQQETSGQREKPQKTREKEEARSHPQWYFLSPSKVSHILFPLFIPQRSLVFILASWVKACCSFIAGISMPRNRTRRSSTTKSKMSTRYCRFYAQAEEPETKNRKDGRRFHHIFSPRPHQIVRLFRPSTGFWFPALQLERSRTYDNSYSSHSAQRKWK
eukprot:scaffold5888_cov67-Attheya_sp.AAC.4